MYLLLMQAHGQVVGNLSSHGYNHSFGHLEVMYVHNPLEGEFIEIEPVAHIIVCGDGFRIVIDHDGAVTLIVYCLQGIHTTPVKFDTRTDPVGSRSHYNYRSLIVFKLYIVLTTTIGQIEVIGLRRIFGCKRINLFHAWKNIPLFTVFPYGKQVFGDISLHDKPGDLEVTKSEFFGLEQEFIIQLFKRVHLFKFKLQIENIPQLHQEPLINHGQIMNAVDGVTLLKCFFNDHDPHIGGF